MGAAAQHPGPQPLHPPRTPHSTGGSAAGGMAGWRGEGAAEWAASAECVPGPSTLTPVTRSTRRAKAASTMDALPVPADQPPSANTRSRSGVPSPHGRSRSADIQHHQPQPTSSTQSARRQIPRHQPSRSTLEVDGDEFLTVTVVPSSPSVVSPASTSDSSGTADSPPSSPDATERDFDAKTGHSRRPSDSGSGQGGLSRRHSAQQRSRSKQTTNPRRNGPAHPAPHHTQPHQHTPQKLHALVASAVGPITQAAAACTVCLSLLAHFDVVHLIPASPPHLLHPGEHYMIEYINAFSSLFLVSNLNSAVSLGLAAANLHTLHALERSVSATGVPKRTQLALGSAAWAATIALRVTLSWLFGRVLGFAHPEWFSTSAIHQIFAGQAPLILALAIARSIARPARPPAALLVLVLASNFLCPVANGGSGPWIGLSASVIGLLLGFGVLSYQTCTDSTRTAAPQPKSGRRLATTLPSWLLQVATLLLIPALGTVLPGPVLPSPWELDVAFSSLHTNEAHLLTILLMTAPRPGNPDYLLHSVESWLGALPNPDSIEGEAAGRVRLVVYTHFGLHDSFDSAEDFFAEHPLYAEKNAHYVEWYRDPRGAANRLDQRLHVARGLAYAAGSGGESAYVLLAEDDFPLCPDEDPVEGVASTWHHAWADLQQALVDTNAAMPDYVDIPAERAALGLEGAEALSGHCGVFLTTGGSGLAIRGFIAQQLPSLLLGADDPTGDARDGRLARGEFTVKKEDEGADTPDVVIQDCLRGRHAGCEVCASPGAALPHVAAPFPDGSVRNPRVLAGERWGKSGLTASRRLLQHHLGYNASTLPGRRYGKEEWACGWRQPFNGEPDVLTL